LVTPAAKLYLGLISGTSCDGIDAALVSFAPFCLHQAKTFPFPNALRALSLALGQGQTMVNLDDLGQLDAALGAAFSDAANSLISAAGISADQVQAIGSHGQTVRHRPNLKHAFTLQLGCPHVIAERTGIKVVADFRRRDVAAGGQGAPLVPAFHAAIFPRGSAVLNLGGIANVTILTATTSVSPDRRDCVLGFDTGPANCLLDAHAQAVFGLTHDACGKIAGTGKVNAALLSRLLDDPYFQLPPPKSTGREVFNLAWMRARAGVTLETVSAIDIQATLLELTAVSIANALKRYQINELLVCGGGVHCPPMLARLAALCGVPVASTASHGVDPDFVEAAAFAWLARETLAQRPGNRPEVTGASGLRVLGAVI
jgi:anhydro-N-acetylmuramic acid kinase